MQELQKHNSEISTSLTGRQSIVKAFDDPKIRDCSDDQIKMELKYIFALVGLREYPTDARKQVLIDFIRENYGFYALTEIKIAFQMAVKREIDCETNHFEMFSPSYFGQIFGAYIEYRNRIAKEHMIKQQREKDLEEQNKKPSAEEIKRLEKEFFDQVIKPLFQGYKENGSLNFGITPVRIVYQSLKKSGHLKLSKEEIEEIKVETKQKANKASKVCKLTGEEKTRQEVWLELCQKEGIKRTFDKIESL